ncbi:MAG: NAD(P)/FAD-dependent oxidoreductase [Solirubrobacteraceae bacterium]|nr:NAD(P)/FAD-dependent oxidoreductase [Solirubrobacteraceae bacterium]
MSPTATHAVPSVYRAALPDEVRVAIVGSGFSGLGMAKGLLDDGERDFVVLERADDIGGTWRDNSYPGCACDVPSHMYSFSWAQNPNWTRAFAGQEEIWAYQRDVAARFGINPYVRTGAGVTDATWDDDEQRWTLTTDRGVVRARFLVSGTGPLCEPKYPDLPGLDRFEGTTFHSARWDHDHDLSGKRVAVIGTGASAIQFVPRIQPKVASLTLFQRTPPWIMPRPDRPIGRLEGLAYRRLPLAKELRRARLYAELESRVLPFAYVPQLRGPAKQLALRHLRKQVKDPALRAKLTPDYDLGCKRVLLSNDYLPSLDADNAEVVTAGIREVRERSIVDADGVEHEVDTIIFGTGFHVTDQPIADAITGREGHTLAETWQRTGMQAHRGCTIAGFPNVFMLVGPNTGLGHNSIIYMIEAQVTYVREALKAAAERGAASLEVRPDVQTAENDAIQARLRKTVWNDGGCESWYLDENGRNTTLWPDFTFVFRERTKRFRPEEHVMRDAGESHVAAGGVREAVPA